MKILRVLLIVVLMSATVALLPGQSTASAAEHDCLNVSGTGRDGFDPRIGPLSLSAGTKLTATATRTGAVTDIFMEIYIDGNPPLYINDIPSLHSATVEIPVDADNVFVFFGMYGDGDTTYSVTTEGCATTTIGRVDHPEDAVQGTVTSTTPLYWSPGNLTNPEYGVEAGKNLYTGGLDESGMYRQVLIVCDWLWIPADAIGPNYESPWNGTPLVNDYSLQSGNVCSTSSPASAPVEWFSFGGVG